MALWFSLFFTVQKQTKILAATAEPATAAAAAVTATAAEAATVLGELLRGGTSEMEPCGRLEARLL